MTIEEKQETLLDMRRCIMEAKRYFDGGSDFFTVQSGAWKIEFDMTSQSNRGGAKGESDGE